MDAIGEPESFDEGVEMIHRAFCDPEHELVGQWDRDMAAALKRNGFAIVRHDVLISSDEHAKQLQRVNQALDALDARLGRIEFILTRKE